MKVTTQKFILGVLWGVLTTLFWISGTWIAVVAMCVALLLEATAD